MLNIVFLSSLLVNIFLKLIKLIFTDFFFDLQTNKCDDCGESPESHIYCYTHQNGNLSVQVKSLPVERRLLGAKDGKIWMWTRCLKCNHESGIPRPTKRVVMSTAAHGLSFGKFLELSFSSHSPARRLLSRCGHLLHRDCLRFFGYGRV